MPYPVLPPGQPGADYDPNDPLDFRPGDAIADYLSEAHHAPPRSLTFPLMTAQRRSVSITLRPAMVFDLQRRCLVGTRIARSVRRVGGESALHGNQRIRLEPMDFQRIDVETLKHGLGLFDLSTGGAGILPAFWSTVATTRGRFSLLYAGLQTDADPGRLLVEIMGLGPGIGVEGVVNACEHIQAQRRGVVLHAAPDLASIARLGLARPNCLSLDFASVATRNLGDWAEAERLIVAARKVAPHVLISHLSPERGEAAAEAGATHAVFAPLSEIKA